MHTGPIVLLSGDVHSSHTSRLAFWADTRFGRARREAACPGGSAHLVASAFKNQAGDTIGQHRGFLFVPDTVVPERIEKAKVPVNEIRKDYRMESGSAGIGWHQGGWLVDPRGPGMATPSKMWVTLWSFASASPSLMIRGWRRFSYDLH